MVVAHSQVHGISSHTCKQGTPFSCEVQILRHVEQIPRWAEQVLRHVVKVMQRLCDVETKECSTGSGQTFRYTVEVLMHMKQVLKYAV